MRPKVFCECKAREFKIIEARRHETFGLWSNWCPPDPAPEQEIVYEQVVLTSEDLPPPVVEPLEVRDLMIQIDLPPIEPGTQLSDEVYDEDELDAMGSVEELENEYDNVYLSDRSQRSRKSRAGVIVASSLDRPKRSSIPKVSKIPQPRPRSLYDTKPKPKPRVRAIVMQTDSDPGPLRERFIQYEKQCVCQPGPGSKCTCRRDGRSCNCKTPSPLDGGPPCICKPKFGPGFGPGFGGPGFGPGFGGPGFRTRRRKKCKSRKCKKCREKGLSGRDVMAKMRTKDEKMKEEQEKIRIEKAKLKAMKQVQKQEGRMQRREQAKDKYEMKAAAERIKHQMRQQDHAMKEQKRKDQIREKRVKEQLKDQQRQLARDEAFKRRLSEMRKPEAEFCGCKDWQKGLCKVKIPPDILEAQEALRREQQAAMGVLDDQITTMSVSHSPVVSETKTTAMAVMLARSIDNSDSEFIMPTQRQSRRQTILHKYQNEADNYIAIATVSKNLRDSIFEITNRLSLSENDVREARYLNNELLRSGGRELRNWNDNMRLTCSSFFHRKPYSPQRQLKENATRKKSHENAISKNFKSKCGITDTEENCQQNNLTKKSLYPRRRPLTPSYRYSEDHNTVATTSTAYNSKVSKNISPAKTNTQSTTRRRILEHEVPTTELNIKNNIIISKISNKAVRPRHAPVCTNVAETVFTYSNDETESTVNINHSILTQQNNSYLSKSGLHGIVEKVLSKRRKGRNKEGFQPETQHNWKQIKGIEKTGPKVKLDKNRTDTLPQGSIKMVNSRLTKRKFAKNIVTSLISLFNNSSCRMPKGASSVMPAQLEDACIAEEPFEGPNCGRPLFAVDSGVTSVAERPGLHLLGSPPASPPPPPPHRRLRGQMR